MKTQAQFNMNFSAFELSEQRRIEKKASKAFRNARKTRKNVWQSFE